MWKDVCAVDPQRRDPFAGGRIERDVRAAAVSHAEINPDAIALLAVDKAVVVCIETQDAGRPERTRRIRCKERCRGSVDPKLLAGVAVPRLQGAFWKGRENHRV